MDGSTKLVNNSPRQPGAAFFHYPKMPSYMRQQNPRPFVPHKRGKQEPYLPMGMRDYTNFDSQKPRTSMRRAVDYSSTVVRQLEARIWQRDERDHQWVQPDPSYGHMLLPPSSFPKNSSNAVTTKFVHCSTNKVRCPVFCVVWTPEGRRLVTGASSGEFTLWNGLTFNFETILQAHDYSIRSMCWSHNDLWLLSGDDMGYVKYWQSNMNNVQMFQAHKNQAIRGVSFAPTDSKFASCSDDGTVRIWDFLRCHEERIMRGHGADVRCVDWHQQRGLVVSGSKDNQQPIKLWDPRSGNHLTTIHGHKGTVMAAKFSNNGNWLITASRDHLCKSFDLRVMKEMYTYRGHKKEATSLSLHPIHEDLFVSGGSDGSILFWQVENEREIGSIEAAHDSMVWGLSWHPLGHMLCSGSNDHSTKFWSRNRPGDKMRDRYNLNTLPIGASEELREYDDDSAVTPVIPGMGLETTTPQEQTTTTTETINEPTAIPGLDASADEFAQITPVPQRKVAYARPVPSDFQREWESKKAPGIAPDLEEQERARRERDRAERRRKERQKEEEERRRRDFEREQIRKREAEYKEQREQREQENRSQQKDDENMDQGDIIPGFGPDGQAKDGFPLPMAPPPPRPDKGKSKTQRRAEKRRARRAREREEREMDERRQGNNRENDRGEDPGMKRERSDRDDQQGRDGPRQDRDEPCDMDDRLRDTDGRTADRDRRSHDMGDWSQDSEWRERDERPHNRDRRPHDMGGRPNDRDRGSQEDMDYRSRDRSMSHDRNDHPPDVGGHGPPDMDHEMFGHDEKSNPNEERYHPGNPGSMDYDNRDMRQGPRMMGPRGPHFMGPNSSNRLPLGPRNPNMTRPRHPGMAPGINGPREMGEPGPGGMDGPMLPHRGGPARKPGGPLPLMALHLEKPSPKGNIGPEDSSADEPQEGPLGFRRDSGFGGGDVDYRNSPREEGPRREDQGGRERPQPDGPRGMPFNQEHSSPGPVRPGGGAKRGGDGAGSGMGGDYELEQGGQGSDMDMRQREPPSGGPFQGPNSHPPKNNSRDGDDMGRPRLPEKGVSLPDEYSESNFIDRESFAEDEPLEGSRLQIDGHRPPEKRPWSDGPGEPGFDRGRRGRPRGGRGGRGHSRGGGPRGGGPRGGGFMNRGRGRGNRGGRGRGKW